MLKAALQYIKLGWKIFPCSPGQKTPATKHGVKDATDSEDQIREWWTKTPSANIAVACGQASGVHVVDVDVSEIGVNGWNTLSRLALEGNVSPVTIKSNTPRGGAHFFYYADNPPKNKNSLYPGIDIRSDGYYVVLPPSVHPNGKRYKWAEGMAPWERKPAGFPDFMRPAELAQPVTPYQPPPVAQPADDDILRRASAYLAECDPAVQGEAGHDKLLWAAVCLVHGFLLSDSQTYDLLVREYNPRCEPPWELSNPKDAKDFSRKITEARKLTPKNTPGWLLNEGSHGANEPILNVQALIASAKRASGKLQQMTSRSMPEYDATKFQKELQFLIRPTGLLGDICGWINSTSMCYQPFLTLGCALTFCGVLFGRKVKDHLGTRTNLYCMGIADSSAGKNHAMDQVRRLSMEAGCLDLFGGDDFASDTSIEARLEKNPATLFMTDEIGHVLLAIKNNPSSHTAKIISLLMKLYSASKSVYMGREYADIEKRRTLIQPCCCLWGVSSTKRFIESLDPGQLDDGWLARCLVFQTDSDPDKNYDSYDENVPEGLAKIVHAWFARKIEPKRGDSEINTFVTRYGLTARPPTQLLVPTEEEAKRIYEDFNKYAIGISKEDRCDIKTLWRKAEENARRIGLIVATGEDFENPIITPAIADYACRLVHYLLVDFSRKAPEIGLNPTEEKKLKLLAIIGEAGIQGCVRRDLTQKSRKLLQRERRALIDDLLEAELVAKEITGKTVTYWTAENYLAFRLKQGK